MAGHAKKQGLTILREGQRPVVADVIFVHGLRGDAIETWSKGSVCWPRDLLHQDLPHVRIMTWGYDSAVANPASFASQSSIFCFAEDLLGDAARKRRLQDQATRPIVFVGHSLGGLVIKQALIRSSEYLHNDQDKALGRLYTCTAGVVFFGTPHRGSGKAGLAQLVATAARFAYGQPNSKLIDNLKRDSDVLEQQRKSFASITNSMPLVCFVEQNPTKIGMIVPFDSAVIDGFRVKSFSIPGDHSEMCKYASASDIGYERSSGQIIDIVDTAIEEQEKCAAEKIDSEQRKIIDSLQFKTMNYRYQDIAEAHKRTFEWCYEEPGPGLVQWLRNGSGIFWVNGKAGSGKSTLMKFVFDDERTKTALARESCREHQSLVGFFFSDRGTDLEKTLTGLLRSILLQILSSFPGLVPFILPQYRRGLSQGVHTDREIHEWLDRDLRSALETITKQKSVSGDVCMFIDGLDEYSGDHEEIVEIFRSIVALSNVSSIRVKICVSSRPLIVFKHGFRTFRHLKVQDLTSRDIETYVIETLQSYGDLNKPLPSAVTLNKTTSPANLVAGIVCKASGVFLWVRLVVKSLGEGLRDGDNVSELYDRLATLPSDLDDLYRSMLQKIPSQYRENATQLFGIVHQANLMKTLLNIFQLALADDGPEVAIARPCRPMDQQAKLARSHNMADRVQSRCAGLIEVLACDDPEDFDNSKVQLIHQTFKKFLDAPENQRYWRSGGPTQVDPDLSILSSLVSKMKIEVSNRSAMVTAGDGWYSYNIDDLAYIAKHLGSDSSSIPVRLLDEMDRVLRLMWTKVEPRRKGNHDILPISLGETFSNDMYRTLKHYLKEKIKSGRVDVRTKLPYCSLFYVIDSVILPFDWAKILNFKLPDNLKTLTMLLEHGASPNRIFQGMTAWQYAIFSVIVKSGYSVRVKSGYSVRVERLWELHEYWLPMLHILLDYGAIPHLEDANNLRGDSEALLHKLFPKRLETNDDRLHRLKDELWIRIRKASSSHPEKYYQQSS